MGSVVSPAAPVNVWLSQTGAFLCKHLPWRQQKKQGVPVRVGDGTIWINGWVMVNWNLSCCNPNGVGHLESPPASCLPWPLCPHDRRVWREAEVHLCGQGMEWKGVQSQPGNIKDLSWMKTRPQGVVLWISFWRRLHLWDIRYITQGFHPQSWQSFTSLLPLLP